MNEIRITMTDGYKFSMAEAGFPLRTETFYYTHRRGGANGWHFMPVDPKEYVKSLLKIEETNIGLDYKYLDEHSYSVGAAARKAFSMTDSVKVTSIPKGSWFYNRESAFSASGPSALGSWLEPNALMLHFRVQVATQAKINNLPTKLIATCEREKEIIIESCEAAGRKPPEIEVRSEEYYNSIHDKAKALIDAVKDPDRLFEVGMRAVSCIEQHEIALRAIRDLGIMRTANVYLAQQLGMTPVGTMGHEHVMRFGNSYQS
jgi:nicotinate phosphoribosyltransferase